MKQTNKNQISYMFVTQNLDPTSLRDKSHFTDTGMKTIRSGNPVVRCLRQLLCNPDVISFSRRCSPLHSDLYNSFYH